MAPETQEEQEARYSKAIGRIQNQERDTLRDAAPAMLEALHEVDIWAATMHGWTKETAPMWRKISNLIKTIENE